MGASISCQTPTAKKFSTTSFEIEVKFTVNAHLTEPVTCPQIILPQFTKTPWYIQLKLENLLYYFTLQHTEATYDHMEILYNFKLKEANKWIVNLLYEGKKLTFKDNTVMGMCGLKLGKEYRLVLYLSIISIAKHPGLNLQNALYDDFENLLKSGEGSDVTIISNEKEFKAHKLILRMRSKDFDTMFKLKDGDIVLDSIRPEIMQILLTYIYTGRAEKIDEDLRDLYKAAEMFKIESLKEMCLIQMLVFATVSNVVDNLKFIEDYALSEFKIRLMDFVSEHMDSVTEGDSWKSLTGTHSPLIRECLAHFMLRKKPTK